MVVGEVGQLNTVKMLFTLFTRTQRRATKSSQFAVEDFFFFLPSCLVSFFFSFILSFFLSFFISFYLSVCLSVFLSFPIRMQHLRDPSHFLSQFVRDPFPFHISFHSSFTVGFNPIIFLFETNKKK